MNLVIRELREEDCGLLADFLYEAIFVPAGVPAPPRSIVERPELQIYIENFGTKKDDAGWIAEIDGKAAGAVWVRIMRDYGHVDDETPSLAISVLREYRGRGIGTALMQKLAAELRAHSVQGVSLAVQKANYAAKWYRRFGFEVVGENEEEWIMLRRL